MHCLKKYYQNIRSFYATDMNRFRSGDKRVGHHKVFNFSGGKLIEIFQLMNYTVNICRFQITSSGSGNV